MLADRYGVDPEEIEGSWSDRGVNRLLFLLEARREAERLRERGFKPRGKRGK